MKLSHLNIVAKELAKALRPRLNDLTKRVASLESQLASFDGGQKNLADAHQGPWQGGVVYDRGDLVTFQGSVWLCLEKGAQRPNADSGWRLVVKHGKDAR